jgi:Virulence-associated protein E/Bifunctional DNA primase/polymerase, N-terminal/Primase C terminal 1 (PriCT-1)
MTVRLPDPERIALWLARERGLSVIALRERDKRPIGSWVRWQHERADAAQIHIWFTGDGRRRNVGIVTGKISRVIAVDCDSAAAIAWADRHLPPSPMCTATAKGQHRFFRHPGEAVTVPNTVRIRTADPNVWLDLRADGGYVVGPGSLHPSGTRYTKLGDWPPVDELPLFERTWIERDPTPGEVPRADEPITAGRRNAALWSLARSLHARGLSAAAILAALRTENQTRCRPPLDDAEVIALADHAATHPDRDDEWVRDKRGRIVVGNLKNIRAALTRLDVRSTYDAFGRELRVNEAPVVDEVAFERLWTRITDTCGWQPNRVNLHAVLVCDAHERGTHPVRQYLGELVWDGTPRLDRWLIDYAGAADTKYVRAVSALPLLAAVRRVRSPGAKFDELLILESPQGTGKSSALRALCAVDEWFSDDLPLGVDTKVAIERTVGKWIVEAAELHGNRGRETETLKAFLSRQVDGPVRLAYGRLSISVPRQFVIIGTTNRRAHYLKDSTGARRFWPVSLVGFDVAALLRDRDQLWAEAVQREPDASIRLAADLWAEAAAEQEARRAGDPWEDVIDPLLGDGIGRVEQIAATEIWDALGLAANQRDNRQADRVAAILERRGFEKTKNSAGRMVWRRGAVQNSTL